MIWLNYAPRYLMAHADANVARASAVSNQQEYQRLLTLNRDNKNISDRAVAIAEGRTEIRPGTHRSSRGNGECFARQHAPTLGRYTG